MDKKPTGSASNLAQKLLGKAQVKLVASRKLFDADLWEDSASRSYYAMFHAARAALTQIGVSPKTHEGTVSEFGRRLVLNGTFPREMGRALADAKSARETYEYSAIEEISNDEARNLLENAEKFVSLVETFLATRKNSAHIQTPARSTRSLSDSLGGWRMSTDEEAEIFSDLRANRKKTTIKLRRTGKKYS